MCGICGIVNSHESGAVDIAVMKKMLKTIVHRGPDEEGICVRGSIGIGIRRLSIIDIVTGHQPIFNEDKSIAVVLNGEIYNFQELRFSLSKKGHRFETKSDTEVIVHLYEDFGVEFPKHLRGMFAIAVLDIKANKLVLARDRIGIKPLYYSFAGGAFLFGSEIKALLAAGLIDKEADPEALDDYLTFLYTPAPKTIFKNIKTLLPGQILVFQNGTAGLSKYWDLADIYRDCAPGRSRKFNEDEITAELYEKLKEAVREELVSDVALGAFLSGGVDSSTIVVLMRELIGKNVKTFSIGFGASSYDELEYAREIAKIYETDHYEMEVNPKMVDLLPKLAGYLDEPFADSSIVPTYLVSKLARDHVTVALSGDGGDESFGGYAWTKINYLLDNYRKIPLFLKRMIAASVKHAPVESVFMKKAARMADCGLDDFTLGFYKRVICFDEEIKGRIYNKEFLDSLGGYSPFEIVRNRFESVRGMDSGSSMLYADSSIYLPDDCLKKVDRMSMANSLEVRVPYLDHRIIEFAAGIPFNLKIKGLTTKYIIKKAFKNKLPKKITRQRKQGFAMPVHDWFRGELKDYSTQLLLNQDALIYRYMRPDYVRTLLEQHRSSKENLGNHIFALIMLELWLRKN